MTEDEVIEYLLSKKNTRIKLCEQSFYHFIVHYFSHHIKYEEFSDYQLQWIEDAGTGINMYVEGHRESAKTTILGMILEIWKICYEKCFFVCNLCYDKKKAKSFNKLIATELLKNKKLKADFGVLFSQKKSHYEEDDIQQTGLAEFVTTNQVLVKAFGTGEAIRGEVYNHPKYGNVRPDHVNVDDIDNHKNTKNINIIRNDMDFIEGEVIGGVDKNRTQMVWLGNVIRKDGRNPRIKNKFKKDPDWKIHSNFIFGKAGVRSGDPVWSRFVHTDKQAKEINEKNPDTFSHVISLEKIRRQEKSNFEPNRLGIPLLKGQTFMKEERIRYTSEDIDFDYIVIGNDPAFSLKKNSDAMGIVVTGYKTIDGVTRKYVLEHKKLEGEQKDEENAAQVIENLYIRYDVIRVLVEKNNGGEVFARILQKRGLAVEVMNASKDKLTRAKEHEGEFMRGQIFFYPGTEELVDEWLEFTGEEGGIDNLVDACVRSFKRENESFGFVS